MTKEQIQVGGTYLAKVGTRMVEVRVQRENGRGGWDATSVATGKPIRLKDPKHLRPVKAAAAKQAKQEEAKAPEAAPEGEQDGDTGTAAPEQPKEPTGGRKAKRKTAAAADAKPKPMSCLDAAAAVLKSAGAPMNCKAMIDAMAEQKLRTSDAPTPAATLSSAILREMTKKGAASRFRKTSPGHFALNA